MSQLAAKKEARKAPGLRGGTKGLALSKP